MFSKWTLLFNYVIRDYSIFSLHYYENNFLSDEINIIYGNTIQIIY